MEIEFDKYEKLKELNDILGTNSISFFREDENPSGMNVCFFRSHNNKYFGIIEEGLKLEFITVFEEINTHASFMVIGLFKEDYKINEYREAIERLENLLVVVKKKKEKEEETKKNEENISSF